MKKTMTRYALAGDIGGTKTMLGLFSFNGSKIKFLKVERFLNARHSSIEDVAGLFLKGVDLNIATACFGVASPVHDGACTLTNMDWRIDAEKIKKRFNIKKAALINDLVATGCGIKFLVKKDLYMLNKGVKRRGNAVIISAGTGLGEAILFWNGSGHIPLDSEGGHADFAPRTDTEIGLLNFLRTRLKHVSCERVLSGQGLENIYRFLLDRSKKPMPRAMSEMFVALGPAPAISNGAFIGRDRLCRDALKLFVSIYGAEAGNLALKAMAAGGVYIGGGIAPGILNAMKGKIFLDSFKDKGRFSEFMSRIPVHVILNDRAALYGATRQACLMLLL
ncbi:MAG: glucokinase [Deltaproteobacteria bacterium]|nr:glucokinase [Deltaproteobacteria bacterium]